MRKLKIYLDTSVISYLDATDSPEKMQDTQEFWKDIQSGLYDVVISDITKAELNDSPEAKRLLLTDLLNTIVFEVIETTDEAKYLASRLIELGIMREKSIDDCHHIAAAIISDCDAIASWNFKHIVNPKTIRGVRTITISEGYKDLMICTPSMLLEGDADDD